MKKPIDILKEKIKYNQKRIRYYKAFCVLAKNKPEEYRVKWTNVGFMGDDFKPFYEKKITDIVSSPFENFDYHKKIKKWVEVKP